MKEVELGRTGELISCIGLGTMYFGSKVDEETSFKMLDYYFEQGGRFLDSANKYASWVPGYRGGESEILIGRWLKNRNNRSDLFITSKVGLPYGSIQRSLKKETIISECEKSLKRMGIETIDLYFAHAFDAETPIDESMHAFQQLKKDGKIRFAGASNFFGWQLSEANAAANRQAWEGFTCIQQRHTYLEPVMRANFGAQLALTPELQEYCTERELRIMAYSPLLGGAYDREDRPIPVQYQSVSTDIRLVRLKEVADELLVSVNEIVLSWMIHSLPGVIPIISGSSVSQLQENLNAKSLTLTETQFALLNQDIAQPKKY